MEIIIIVVAIILRVTYVIYVVQISLRLGKILALINLCAQIWFVFLVYILIIGLFYIISNLLGLLFWISLFYIY